MNLRGLFESKGRGKGRGGREREGRGKGRDFLVLAYTPSDVNSWIKPWST